MQRIIIIAILFMLASCVTQKRCNEKFPPQVITIQKDSIHYVQITKDSISYYSDSSYIRAYLECDKEGRVFMKELQEYKSGKNLNIPHLSVKNNVMTSTCIVDSMIVYHIIKSRLSTKETIKEKTVTINVLTPFQKFRCNAFWIESALLLFILFLIFKKILYGKK